MRRFFLHRQRTRAAWWPPGGGPQRAQVELELGDGAAQGVAVHSQFARRPALIAAILLQDRHDEALLKLTHRLGIQDSASVHLLDECFELVFHRASPWVM